ncbi:sexual development transcription factor nsdd [Gigaspora margarita]|uniref:Sexual development transcription factor nsdd n=1 Tax=Gigaspora margarita TaxID=4874 RepID=A0A8H4AWR4_GIGMA|nr:sexual development transcription factor nsdd [Gigaspora margarita]
MDVNSICSLPPIGHPPPKKIPEFPTSNSSIERVNSLPSPPIIEPPNEKGGPHLPPLTSILQDTTPLPPSIQFPKPQHILNPTIHNTPITPNQHNHSLQSPTLMGPQLSSLNKSYPSYHESSQDSMTDDIHPRPMTRKPSYGPSPLSSLNSNPYNIPTPVASQRQPWQPVEHQQPYHYQQSLPPSAHSLPPPYLYDQQQATRYSQSLPTLPQHSNYPQYSSYLNRDNSESPYVQTTEPPLVKLGKVVDHCSQISQFASQYRDVHLNQGSWNSIMLQVNETQLTNIINRAYDVLNILTGLKNEVTSRNSDPSSAIDNDDSLDLNRKQRPDVTSQRTKYRKRSKRAAPPGRCHSCNISETPEWRRGPDGARTLCNACGLHFAKITRKRALSAMQQQLQQPSSTSETAASDINSQNDANGLHDLASMPTPGASDAEKDSPPLKQSRIELNDDKQLN